MGKFFDGCVVFNRCDFLLGQDSSIVIVIPAHLPRADHYTVSVNSRSIRFKAGHDHIVELDYPGGEIFERIANSTQVGLIEYPQGVGDFPACITNVAYVEVRRAQ